MTAAILDFCPATAPASAMRQEGAADLARLLGLDRLSAAPRRLVCRWRRDADGRLAAVWEPDIVPVPHR